MYERETSTKANRKCARGLYGAAVHHLHHNNSVQAYQEIVTQ